MISCLGQKRKGLAKTWQAAALDAASAVIAATAQEKERAAVVVAEIAVFKHG